MPAYNAALYIEEAVQSILKQTFRNFELLIINDGSTDSTLSLLRSFNDNRIRVISQENKGLIDTLNIGLQEASADIIARMDADDISYPERLQKQFDFLNQHADYVLVGSEADIIDKDGEFVYKLTLAGYSDEDIRQNILNECPFVHPSVMFRKEAVLKAGGYPKNALTFEDHLLWRKLEDAGKLFNFGEPLVAYRFNPGSVTIDEKWRGGEFMAIRKRSIDNGFATDEDAATLARIIKDQNTAAFKTAAYHATIAKKYLWTNPDGKRARYHLREVIKHYPKNKESYILYLFALLPSRLRTMVYHTFKKR